MNPQPALVANQPTLTVVSGQVSEPAAGVDVLADKIRSLEQWYAADFERRVASITELLRRRLAEEAHAQLAAEVEERERQIRDNFEERLYARAGEWQSQQAALQSEIEELKRRVPSRDLLEEISSVEAAVNRYASADRLGAEPATPASLSRSFQGKVEELELRAYLKGLKFKTRSAEPQ